MRNLSLYLSVYRSLGSSSLKFCNHFIAFTYFAPALWNGLPKVLRHFTHLPNPPLSFLHLTSTCIFLCYVPFTTEDRTLQAIVHCILSRFYSCATTRTCSPAQPCNRSPMLSPRLDLL